MSSIPAESNTSKHCYTHVVNMCLCLLLFAVASIECPFYLQSLPRVGMFFLEHNLHIEAAPAEQIGTA